MSFFDVIKQIEQNVDAKEQAHQEVLANRKQELNTIVQEFIIKSDRRRRGNESEKTDWKLIGPEVLEMIGKGVKYKEIAVLIRDKYGFYIDVDTISRWYYHRKE